MAGGRALRVVATVCAVAATAVALALAGAALLFPGDQDAVPRILAPGSPWPLPVLAVVAAVAVTAGFLSRRPRPSARRVSFVVAAWSGASAVVLGAAAIARCPSGGDTLFATGWQTMILFVGTSPEAFDQGTCEGPVPLAAQWARTAAMAAVFATAVALTVTAASTTVRRHRFRRRPVREVVIGLDQDSVPLVGALLRRTVSEETVVVVILGTADPAAIEVAHDMGADVFELDQIPIPRLDADPWRAGDPAVLAEALYPFIVTRRRITVRHLWVTSAGPDVADQVCAAVAHLAGADPPGHDISVMTRSGSALHARRERARALPRPSPDDHAHLLLCPVSEAEVAAMEVVGRVLAEPPGTIVVLGGGPMASAVLHELALRWWEAQARDRAGDPALPNDDADLLTGGWSPGRVIVASDDADLLLQRWRRSAPGPVRPAAAAWTANTVGTDVFDSERVRAEAPIHCLLTEPVADSILELLLVDERLTVWEPRSTEAETRALRRGDRRDRGYTCDLLMAGWPPEDPWTRVARHVHEVRRRQGRAADLRPWWHSDADQRLPAPTREKALADLRALLVAQQSDTHRWEYQPQRALPAGGTSNDGIVLATLAAHGYVLTDGSPPPGVTARVPASRFAQSVRQPAGQPPSTVQS